MVSFCAGVIIMNGCNSNYRIIYVIITGKIVHKNTTLHLSSAIDRSSQFRSDITALDEVSGDLSNVSLAALFCRT